jgi:hypothetical protein
MNAIRFVLQGMRELPGRKSMIIISDNLPVEDRRSQSSTITGSPQGGGGAAAMSVEPASGSLSVDSPLRRISELAIRASVVIYGIDVRGLPDVTTISPPDTSPPNASGMTPSQRSARFNLPGNEVDSGREVGASLARQTGGRLIYNTNDIGGSLRRVMEDQKGYYLIGYRPGGETFNRRFHKISVRVKRPGLTARTRTGFYGVTDEDARPAPPTARDQTLTALMSARARSPCASPRSSPTCRKPDRSCARSCTSTRATSRSRANPTARTRRRFKLPASSSTTTAASQGNTGARTL